MQDLDGGVWGGAVAPLTFVYVVFLAMLVAYRRAGAPDDRRAGEPSARWPALLRHLLATAAGGYLAFLAIVIVFSFMFAEEEEAIGDALGGGSFLAVLAIVVLAIGGWVEGVIRTRGRQEDSEAAARIRRRGG